ncbi:unnamed protein product [Durusdinium trenchii]|uniref:PA domain-containing protein n=1 Tax=Durusdinium trenchii TaxID=1381693 RepID=A0ABP0LYY6_9DINO
MLKIGLASLLQEISGHYVVHFFSGQGQTTANSDSVSPFVPLSVAGRSFRCELPRLPQQSAASETSDTYVAQLRSASLRGRCLVGSIDGEKFEFQLCVGETFAINGQVAFHEPLSQISAGYGFQQRYKSEALHAHLLCSCHHPPPAEQAACDLGQHVWIQEKLADDLAMVVGFQGDELLLRWTQQGQARGAFPMAHTQLRAAETGRTCAPREAKQKHLIQAKRHSEHLSGDDEHFAVELKAPTCCSTKEMEQQEAVISLLTPLEGMCHYAQNGWWTYEICWPWHVRRLHFYTTNDPDAQILREFTDEDGSSTVITGATRTELGANGGIIGFFGNGGAGHPHIELRRALARGSSHGLARTWPQEVVVQLEPGDDCRIMANNWLLQISGPGSMQVTGIGGSFNPVHVDSASGHLATATNNPDACDPFVERFDGAVLLVKRGRCFFQVKATNAEDAGAVAVVVYNDHRPDVSISMEGVGDEYVQLSEPISAHVIFRCGEDFQRSQTCQVGDVVDVKLWVKRTLENPPSLPDAAATEQELHEFAVIQAQADSASLRMLRGQVLDADPGNQSLLVQWLGEQEQSVGVGTIPGMNLDKEPPTSVPLAAAFRDGVRCTSPRDVWIEKLLEPYACNAEFVVHVASLCAMPELAPKKPQEEQGINCQEQTTKIQQ